MVQFIFQQNDSVGIYVDGVYVTVVFAIIPNHTWHYVLPESQVGLVNEHSSTPRIEPLIRTEPPYHTPTKSLNEVYLIVQQENFKTKLVLEPENDPERYQELMISRYAHISDYYWYVMEKLLLVRIVGFIRGGSKDTFRQTAAKFKVLNGTGNEKSTIIASMSGQTIIFHPNTKCYWKVRLPSQFDKVNLEALLSYPSDKILIEKHKQGISGVYFVLTAGDSSFKLNNLTFRPKDSIYYGVHCRYYWSLYKKHQDELTPNVNLDAD